MRTIPNKELQKIYNLAKIKYNPTDYTLKDRLIIQDKLLDNIMLYGYEAETALLDTINRNRPDNLKYIGPFDVPTMLNTMGITDTYKATSSGYTDSEFKPVGEYALLMDYKNHLHIYSDSMCEILARAIYASSWKDLTRGEQEELVSGYLEKGNVLESIVTLSIALRGASSILPALKFAAYPSYLHYNYEDVKNGKYLLDYLEDNEKHTVPIQYVFIRDMPFCANESSKAYEDIGSDDIRKSLCIDSAFDTILYGIEILHAIESITDESIKKSLYHLIVKTTSFSAASTKITNMLFDIDHGNVLINKDIIDIVLEKDNRVRYNKISLYLANDEVLNKIIKIGKEIYTYKEYSAGVFFGLLVTVCKEYSLQCVRAQNVLVLITYIKSKGWKLPIKSVKDPDKAFSLIKSLGSDDKDDDIFDDDDEDEDGETTGGESFKSKSLLDLDDHGPSGDAPGGLSKPSESTPILASLDSAFSEFKDTIYEYSVKDVIDTTEKYKDDYEAIASKVDLLNKNLIRRIKEIKVYNEGGKNPGLTTGKIDLKNVWKYKTTDKIFYKNTYKIKESDLAFGIILDVSGSMHGSGITNGRITMIILHEALKALNINHSIITHTTHGGMHTCEIKRYQNFREQKTFNIRKNYALASIEAESGNCDSAALKYMETAFEKVRNKDKICLMFSDGAPTECTGTELVDQIRHMERKGIKTIGIGVNYASIKEYYPNNANGKNLKEMLDIVSDILRQYILDKKE